MAHCAAKLSGSPEKPGVGLDDPYWVSSTWGILQSYVLPNLKRENELLN